MRTTWILVKKGDAWISPNFNGKGHKWFMCGYGLCQFFPELSGKKKACLRITKTRHPHAKKLKLCTGFSTYVSVKYLATGYFASLTISPSERLKHLFPKVKRSLVIVYVSITPID